MATEKSLRRRMSIAIAAFVLTIVAPQVAGASKTAEAVADVSAIVAAKDALIGLVCAVVPEPVLTKSVAATFFIKGAIFGLISVGARIYDKTVDKKSSTPKVILSASPIGVGTSTLGEGGIPVVAGFAPVSVDAETGSLNISDGTIRESPPCGVIGVLGSGFSPQLSEDFVLFGTTATAPLGFADLGNGTQVLFVAVPSKRESNKERTVKVRVNVNRILSNSVEFGIGPAPHLPKPGLVTKIFFKKSEIFLSQLIAIDWNHLIDVEAASQGIELTEFDRKVASKAAQVIVGQSQQGLATIQDLENALTANDIALLDPLLKSSVVIEALEVGINLTRTVLSE